MATTVTGSNVSNWEAYFKYTTENVDGDSFKVTMTASGIHNLNKYGFAISSGISTTSYIGSTKKSGSGGFSASGDTYKSIVGSWSHTIKKAHSAQTVTLKAVTKNSSGFQNGTSTASKSINIPARTSYTVSYSANGGSGAPSSQTKWYGETLKLSSTQPTRTGYTFAGWATSSTATTASKKPGDTYTSNAAATYYAVWTPDVFAVSYDGNGGTAPTKTSRTYGKPFTLSATVPTRDGCRFTGWLCGGNVYAAGATVSDFNATASPLTFTAQWELDQYTVSYNANGGDGSMAAVTVRYGTAYSVPGCTFKRKWFSFAGWVDASGNAVTGYDASYRGGNVTLYAKWTQVYFPPALGGLAADRCDSSGGLADDGTSAMVTGIFAVTGAVVTDSTGTTYDGRLRSVTVSHGGTSATASTSGNAFTAVLSVNGGLSPDASHVLTVTVTDSSGSTATANVTLAKAEFTLDFAAGGNGVGVGCPAPARGFEVAFPASFGSSAAFSGAATFTGTMGGKALLNAIYPVGSIYMSVNSTSPATLFGGTWERIKDRFLLSAGDTYSAGATGGESSHTLTASEMPSHSHVPDTDGEYFVTTEETAANNTRVAYSSNGNRWVDGQTSQSHFHHRTGTSTVGSGAAHNNMPPYLAVYVWKRTA